MASGPPQTPPDPPITTQPASPVPAPNDQPSGEPDADDAEAEAGESPPSEPVWPQG